MDESRSVQRRKAIQRGELLPEFDKERKTCIQYYGNAAKRWMNAVWAMELLTPSQKADLLRVLDAEVRQLRKTGLIKSVNKC